MNKNLGKFALVGLPIIVSLILLWPTYKAMDLENKEENAYATAKLKHNRADSLSVINKFKEQYGDDLKSAKDNKLKLGLDLRGGMYVTLEVDVVQLLKESAQKEAIDGIFDEVIEKTHNEAMNSSDDAFKIFQNNFNLIARAKGKTLISYYDLGNSKEVSEAKIIEGLQKNINEAIEQAQQVIRQRIDKFGVSEPNIQLQGNRRIMLELPGVKDQEQMRNLLQTTARLEFKLVRNNQNLAKSFKKIDELLKAQAMRKAGVMPDLTEAMMPDTLTKDSGAVKKDPKNPYAGLTKEQTQKQYKIDHSFTSLFVTMYVYGPEDGRKTQMVDYTMDSPEGDYIFRIEKDSMDKFNEILERSDVKGLLPFDMEVAISAKSEGGNNVKQKNKIEIFDIYGLKKESELVGDVITDANKNIDPTTNAWIVNMSMNTDGAEKWARITGANLKKRIAIVLDGRVYSAPTVQSKITGGSSQISGMANSEEAHLLEIVLKAGALKAPVKIIEERVIGASLGEDSITSGLNASMLAFLLVVIFMLMYYNKGGIIADVAVIINVLLMLSVLTVLKGTLSLPGIAGIILTIGMAVDTNILVFERIREELHSGKTLRASIDVGFSKALHAIIDSNVNSFMTGLILYFMGSGFITGFALTLMIGILTTLFTAIVVSRAMIEISISSAGTTYFNFGQPSSVK